MKTTTITANLYPFSELAPEAQDKAIAHLITQAENDSELVTHQAEEMAESLKSLASFLGYPITDWSIGPYCQGCFAKCNAPDDLTPEDVAEIMESLASKGYTQAERDPETARWPGVCGFTGVCYDDDMVETVVEEIEQSGNLRQGVNTCADTIRQILESECEYLTSEEAIRETIDEDCEEWLEDGNPAPHYYHQAR
jgi:hypothetical protein